MSSQTLSTIKAQAEEVKNVLEAAMKYATSLAFILAGAVLGLPRLTLEEIIAVVLVVMGVSLGIKFAR